MFSNKIRADKTISIIAYAVTYGDHIGKQLKQAFVIEE